MENNIESREGKILLTPEQTPEPEQPLPTHAKPNSDESRLSQYNPDSTICLISQQLITKAMLRDVESIVE